LTGTWADLAAPARILTAAPTRLSLVEAAALPLAGLTASRALQRVKAGRRGADSGDRRDRWGRLAGRAPGWTVSMVDAGELRVRVGACHRVDDAHRAHRVFEAGGLVGKVILTF
jgi:NADPH:quinone reductase-like Zn-dependent oxidoreductase